MKMKPAQELIWQFIQSLPTWGFQDHGESRRAYWVLWHYPPFYERHAEKIAVCPKLQEKIARSCQFVLDSGQFDIDWVELFFREHGLIINVPGNACGIYPDFDRSGQYGSHNIDTSAQCFSLLFFLITALFEIYSTMATWEEDPTVGIEGEPCDRMYRLKRTINSKRYEHWEAIDDGYRTFAIIHARSRDEADTIAAKANVENNLRQMSMVERDYPILSTLQQWRVRVETEDGETIRYQVLASNDDDAKSLVEEKLQGPLLLFPITIKSIVVEECKLPQPMVL
jgi:hypothetical protein